MPYKHYFPVLSRKILILIVAEYDISVIMIVSFEFLKAWIWLYVPIHYFWAGRTYSVKDSSFLHDILYILDNFVQFIFIFSAIHYK